MARRTHYQTLMLDPAADAEVIALVHRHLAARHATTLAGDPDARRRMAELSEAFEVLSDSQRRAAYDAYLGERGQLLLNGGPGARERRNGEADRGDSTSDRPSGRSPGPEEARAGGLAPGTGSGVISFGRYRGWTLAQVARVDRPFLEWLDRSPAGRVHRDELARLLGWQGRWGGG